jgi:membrane associated rhomboid family serine protease
VSDDDDQQAPPLLSRWATFALVVVNVGVGVAMALGGASPFYASGAQLIDSGAIEPTRVWSGEVWRLLSACFVHIGVWHLAMNAWVLWIVGTPLERLVGGARALLI